jgi:hypothetical protein
LAEIGIRHLTFVKIDKERFDPYTLKGLHEMLALLRAVVFFEWFVERAATLGEEALSAPRPGPHVFYRLRGFRPVLGFFSRRCSGGHRCSENKLHSPDECDSVAIPMQSDWLLRRMTTGGESKQRSSD